MRKGLVFNTNTKNHQTFYIQHRKSWNIFRCQSCYLSIPSQNASNILSPISALLPIYVIKEVWPAKESFQDRYFAKFMIFYLVSNIFDYKRTICPNSIISTYTKVMGWVHFCVCVLSNSFEMACLNWSFQVSFVLLLVTM